MSCEIVQIEVGMLQNFNELVADVATGACAVVDPAYEPDRLLRLARERGWRITTVLVTHTHPDHIEAVEAICAATAAVVRVGAGEAANVARAAPSAHRIEPISGGHTVSIAIGGETLTAISTPGHTVDGVSYYTGDAVMTGDTLFVGGVGRTDFPGGDAATLFRSLQKILALPEETRIYPGHDYGATVTSTVAWERDNNPYLRCRTAEEFVALRTGRSPPRPARGPRG